MLNKLSTRQQVILSVSFIALALLVMVFSLSSNLTTTMNKDPYALPGNVKLWTPMNVADWLDHIGLDSVKPSFLKRDVDGELLLSLRDSDLVTLGIKSPETRVKLMKNIELLKHDQKYVRRYVEAVKFSMPKELMNPLKEALRKVGLTRKAYMPVLREGQTTTNTSRLGGVGVLIKGETWPRCELAGGEPMQLVIQIDLKTAPAKLQEILGKDGYFQFLRCPVREFSLGGKKSSVGDRGSWAGKGDTASNDKKYILRVVEEKDASEPDDKVKALLEQSTSMHPREVLEWTAVEDFPPVKQALKHTTLDLPQSVVERFFSEYPLLKDKLLGFANRAAYSGLQCKTCPGTFDTLIFQAHDGGHTQFPGVGHVVACSCNRKEMIFDLQA